MFGKSIHAHNFDVMRTGKTSTVLAEQEWCYSPSLLQCLGVWVVSAVHPPMRRCGTDVCFVINRVVDIALHFEAVEHETTVYLEGRNEAIHSRHHGVAETRDNELTVIDD